ncbi:phospholipid carrier-dependent glycosyltransferase [Pontibacter sp. HSC-14F20]|uniref:ArnT family glycosyltransferase n=1 Tax=Pontibacter sp. HSC-14F20 TaxID=2864136 RepID=UPI001C72CCFD|nr:phospholipid carrier-dependent glycosyltransferase [Pontibacter sp. HSC-14F20]MBX0331887.1 phospholipid carrier-dependent glycosyltransferase [Pontibacter sp. HSC-14F20]
MNRAFAGLRHHTLVAALLFVFLLILLYNLGGWGVIETSEARYAEISREMLWSGDWLHPRLLGIQHFHKPPITYIISAAGMGLFGVNEFGVRFFLQISLVAQALLVYLIAVELFKSRKIALTALIVYITIPAVLIAARNLTTDSFLAAFELLAIWAWLRYKPAKKPAWLYLFYLALALAFLTKGPVGLIFPVLVVIGYRVKQPIGQASLPHHLLAFLLFLVVSASWYVYLMWQDRQFIDYFILNHIVKRYTSPDTFGRSEPWWFYVVFIPVLSLPWSAMLLLHFQKLRTLIPAHKRLFLLWLLVPLLFFSASGSKLILYVLPMLAGIALLVSWLLYQLTAKDIRSISVVTFLYLGLIGMSLVLLPFLPLGLTVPQTLVVFAVLMLVVLYLIWRFMKQGIQQVVAAVLAFILFLIPFSTHLLGANAEQVNSSKALANLIRQENLQDRTIVVYDRLLPSLAFELNKDIVSVSDQHHSLNRETQFETSDAWRNHLFHINDSQDSTRLRSLLDSRTVLISKRELPRNRNWLRRQFAHTRQVGVWIIYY